jgi:hypothetical protein
MPETSAAGHRATHIWRINAAPFRSDGVTLNDEEHNGKTELNDSNANANFWMNSDGTTGSSLERGKAETFLTLDMVCMDCHKNEPGKAVGMSWLQLAKAAKYIHRQPGVVDLTINGSDNLQVVKRTTRISVDFDVAPDEAAGAAGQAADWYVLQQKPKGWSYWNGTAWKTGLKRWRSAPVQKISKNVLNAPLTTAGNYTFWVQLDIPNGAEYADSVPVYVSKR